MQWACAGHQPGHASTEARCDVHAGQGLFARRAGLEPRSELPPITRRGTSQPQAGLNISSGSRARQCGADSGPYAQRQWGVVRGCIAITSARRSRCLLEVANQSLRNENGRAIRCMLRAARCNQGFSYIEGECSGGTLIAARKTPRPCPLRARKARPNPRLERADLCPSRAIGILRT